MEGVMMRNGDLLGLAVRLPNGEICAQRSPWYSITNKAWLSKPFIRGFPILLETMINGIRALNLSMSLALPPDQRENSSKKDVIISVCIAILMAIALFVIAPHLLSLLMLALGLGGDVEGLSFHLWDGFYKCAIFILYIWLISFVPEIKRVFEYHGAEHKTIHALETCDSGPDCMDCLDTAAASRMSRLHPRCGTTFLLFVICISIVLQAVLVPPLLKIASPQGMLAKHALSVVFKLMLMVPISAVAYELIRFAARLPQSILATLLQAPGLALQRLTTREPDAAQLEVAIVALAEALGPEESEMIRTVPYRRLECIHAGN